MKAAYVGIDFLYPALPALAEICEILKIFTAEKANGEVKAPVGTVVLAKKKQILLQLKDGQVALEELQRPGKKIMKAIDFNNGVHDLEGSVLK